MKRFWRFFVCGLLIACMVSGQSFAMETDGQEKWFASDDGMVEIKVVSLKETTYPSYELTLVLRLDGVESKAISYNYDLTNAFNYFINENPSYKNRKIKATTEGVFNSFKYQRGTQYVSILQVKIGGTLDWTFTTPIDLSTTFPDEFVNYDVLNAAACVSKYAEFLLNPSTLKVDEVMVHDSKEEKGITYYTFKMSAENKMGGMTSSYTVGRYDTSVGKFDLIDIDADKPSDSEIVFNGTNTSTTALSVLMDWMLGYESAQEISVASVMGRVYY